MKRIDFIIVTVFGFIISGCNLTSKEIAMQKINVDMENGTTMMSEHTRTQGDAHGGQYFSRIGGGQIFGGGSSTILADSIPTNRTKVIIEAWCRSSVLQTKGAIIVSAAKDGFQVAWNPFLLAGIISEPNQWTFIKDSIELPKRIDGKLYNSISVFSYIDQSSNEKFDIDDLIITVKRY